MTDQILATILIVLISALAVTVIFRMIRLPVILGYIAVGALLGPHAFGLVTDVENINKIAEFGVAFLLFTIGLEFSITKLITLRYPVFILGGLQVIISMIITCVIGYFAGMGLFSSIVVGGVVAMSSTAVVVKQLMEQLQHHTTYGSNAIGILLFQDLAVVPIIILISNLSGEITGTLLFTLSWALINGIIAIFVILVIGRWLLRPVFHLISSTRTIELFTLMVLLVALSAAWLTHYLGLSLALGAFMAGIMLGETEFQHQIEVEIRPFRDVLLGLFFISIGMLLDVSTWPQTWIWISLLLMALIIGKTLLITLLSRISGYNNEVSFRTGIILAQGGEFGFAILTLALTHQLLPPDYGQVVLSALLISLILAPLIIRFNKNIAEFFLPTTTKISEEKTHKKIEDITRELEQHIIICGFGRVGQNIARVFNKLNITYIGLDLDAKLVQSCRQANVQVIYGDATHPEILKAARLDRAKAILISFDDVYASLKTLDHIRSMNADVPVLVRCKDKYELELLEGKGATMVITETFEESLCVIVNLLKIIEQLSEHEINALIDDIRSTDYALLREVLTSSFPKGT